MFNIEPCDVPNGSLLAEYRDRGAYTDCYTTEVSRHISQAEYIYAFYTTVPFKIERAILSCAVSRPSTDEEARLLADARLDAFSAWKVEARGDDQILLSDYRGKTRSWLMSGSNSLYFGSAVVSERASTSFGFLLRFHKLYSQILLSAAKSRLSA